MPAASRLRKRAEDDDEDDHEAAQVGRGGGDGERELREAWRELQVAQQLDVGEHARDRDDVLRELDARGGE
eukprot:782878-Prymnesium_polylepis.1